MRLRGLVSHHASYVNFGKSPGLPAVYSWQADMGWGVI